MSSSPTDKRERALWLADKLTGDYGSEAAQLLRDFARSHVGEREDVKKLLRSLDVDSVDEAIAVVEHAEWLKSKPVSTSSTVPLVTIREDVARFLLGEGALDGLWFGDQSPDLRGTYWWRNPLRLTMHPYTPPSAIAPRHWVFAAAEAHRPLLEKWATVRHDALCRDHARWMLDKIRDEGFSATKACRWLGWVQAALNLDGVPLDELKRINKAASDAAKNAPTDGGGAAK